MDEKIIKLRKMAEESDVVLKEIYENEDVLKSIDKNYLLGQQHTVKEDEAGMVDVVNLQQLYYSYFDGTESYNGAIVYGPEINTITA